MDRIFSRNRWTGILTAALLLLAAHPEASAQFSLAGSDPASARWLTKDTPHFRLIYPEQMDSIATVYGLELEAAREPLSWSSGYSIGQVFKRKLPVVLHPFHAVPNASVTWAPRRMDIFTVNDAFTPTPMPWERNLAIHEGRHATQMQFTADGVLKPLRWLTGEMGPAAMAGVFPGLVLLEGDAVVAETALTKTGRGRQASFLSFMMPSLDAGDFRDYWQWTHNSLKRFTPDHYRAGYMLVAGSRVFFDDPLFTDEYFKMVTGRMPDQSFWTPPFCNLQRTVRNASGLKFNDAFEAILVGFHSLWTQEALERGPFMDATQVTRDPAIHTTYSGSTFLPDGSILSIKYSLASPSKLVRIHQDGSEETLRPFSGNATRLRFDANTGRVYWTELIGDKRWTLRSTSRIRYIDISDPGKIHDLTTCGKLFNCAPSPDGTKILATDYPVEGGSRIVIISGEDGSLMESFTAPDGLQFLESDWVGGRIIAAGITQDGAGIYEITGTDASGKAELRTVASPQPVEFSTLSAWPSGNSEISFLSDHSGVSEMYRMDIETGEMQQVTSTRYGIEDPFFSNNADTLCYKSIAASDDPASCRKGSMIRATAVKDLPMTSREYSQTHSFHIADVLTEQEKNLSAGSWNGDWNVPDVEMSAPKRYSKVRFPHIHSWAPGSYDSQNIEDISLDINYQVSSLGVTAMFQNLFSTGSGMIGYSYIQDPGQESKWRHSMHLDYTYTGLYPVLEFNLNVNERDRMEIRRLLAERDEKSAFFTNGSYVSNSVYARASLKAYIPFNFSEGGLSRGFIPKIKVSATNDTFYDAVYKVKFDEEKNAYVKKEAIGRETNSILTTLDLSARGYVMQKTTTSQVYPSLGIGAEAGFHTRPGHTDAFKSTAYLYTYGYLPGIFPLQGIRLTASFEASFGKSDYCFPEIVMKNYPRGFAESNITSILNRNSTSRTSATIDYAIPFLPIDRAFLGPVAYVRNLVLTPFLDCSYITCSSMPEIGINPKGISNEFLMSVGADLAIHLGNFFFLPYGTKTGIRVAYNHWNKFNQLGINDMEKFYIGTIFSIDI